MSAVVKTMTPFLDRETLLKALDELGVQYKIQHNEIITERVDYYGAQKFIWQDDRFVFQHDSSANRAFYSWRKLNFKEWKTVSSFLEAVETQYNQLYQEKLAELERQRLEEEARRLEEERKAFVEKQKQTIIEKAKAKGYAVKEKKVGNKIKLVLVRHQ